jgi:hypothetical protein
MRRTCPMRLINSFALVFPSVWGSAMASGTVRPQLEFAVADGVGGDWETIQCFPGKLH